MISLSVIGRFLSSVNTLLNAEIIEHDVLVISGIRFTFLKIRRGFRYAFKDHRRLFLCVFRVKIAVSWPLKRVTVEGFLLIQLVFSNKQKKFTFKDENRILLKNLKTIGTHLKNNHLILYLPSTKYPSRVTIPLSSTEYWPKFQLYTRVQ